jgi:hypothetical protein
MFLGFAEFAKSNGDTLRQIADPEIVMVTVKPEVLIINIYGSATRRTTS